jgi:hypothetical protein
MTEQDRCEFVRNHLPLVVTAAKNILRVGDPAADGVIIDVDELPRPDGKAGDRRKTDRRKTDRRKTARPLGAEPDRRRSARRQGERRSPPPKQDAP